MEAYVSNASGRHRDQLGQAVQWGEITDAEAYVALIQSIIDTRPHPCHITEFHHSGKTGKLGEQIREIHPVVRGVVEPLGKLEQERG